ncbi:PREDICTED: uncharacterized protein LOC106146303, partial [Chinchilla lanigera]|uniref:uncharacterized protein LOC106146303 n=1 Tax=Chinchilla lanigera TaxID=34839 RepID=UPI000696A4F8
GAGPPARGPGERRAARARGGARPSRSRGAATRPSLLKTLPLKWGRVFQLKKRSIFFFSKKADEVGKKRRNRHHLCRGNRSSNCFSEKQEREREGEKEKIRKRDDAQVPVRVKGAETGDSGGLTTKRLSPAAALRLGKQRASRSAPGHSWLAAAALSAAQGDRGRLAKWHRAPKLLGARQEGGGTGCALELRLLPSSEVGLCLPDPPSSGGAQRTGHGKERRRRGSMSASSGKPERAQ